jgi:hypothetical protein
LAGRTKKGGLRKRSSALFFAYLGRDSSEELQAKNTAPSVRANRSRLDQKPSSNVYGTTG